MRREPHWSFGTRLNKGSVDHVWYRKHCRFFVRDWRRGKLSVMVRHCKWFHLFISVSGRSKKMRIRFLWRINRWVSRSTSFNRLTIDRICLVPQLPLRQLADEEIEEAIKTFLTNFNSVYHTEGLYASFGSLLEAMRQSVYDPTEVSRKNRFSNYQPTFLSVLLFQPRPLLIYLHRNGTPATHVFCRNVLRNSDLIELVNENFVFWPWDCTFDSNYNL